MHERIAVEKKEGLPKAHIKCKNVIAGKWLWRKAQHEIFNFINLFFWNEFFIILKS